MLRCLSIGFRRMVMTRHDDSQRIDGLAVTQRGGSRVTRIWAVPTTDYRLPTTDYRLPTTDYRLPTTDYRLPNRAAASRSAPVLTAAPSICAADSRACGSGPRRPQPPPVYINRRCRDFGREGHICARPRGCKMILKEPHARAAMCRGEPVESHAARFREFDSDWPSALAGAPALRCARVARERQPAPQYSREHILWRKP